MNAPIESKFKTALSCAPVNVQDGKKAEPSTTPVAGRSLKCKVKVRRNLFFFSTSTSLLTFASPSDLGLHPAHFHPGVAFAAADLRSQQIGLSQ